MTVKELKEELEKYSEDLVIYVPKTARNQYCMGLVAEAIRVRLCYSGERLYIED